MGEPHSEAVEVGADLSAAVDQAVEAALDLTRGYDRALRRLEPMKERRGAAGVVLAARNLEGEPGPGRVLALIRMAVEARTSDPDACRLLADAAVEFADQLDEPKNRPVRARAWAERGNAQRLQGDYAEARKSLDHALELAERGDWVEPLTCGEVYSLYGSLETSLHHFDQALMWIETALLRMEEAGADTDRLRVKRAHVLIVLGDLPQALEDLVAVLSVSLRQREKDLTQLLATCNNALALLLQIGVMASGDEAREQALSLFLAALPEIEPLFAVVPAPGWQVRKRWLVGRFCLAEGWLELARRALDEVVSAFLDLNQPAAAAVASLELALVLARLGAWDDLRAIASSSCVVFESTGLHADTWGALRTLVECERTEAEAIILEGLRHAGSTFLPRTPGSPTF